MKISKSLFFLLLIFPFTILLGDIINVPADTSTIQGGIYLANEGDTVLVAEDTYFENINFRGKAITVASQFIFDEDTSHISKTIIDGSQLTNPDSGSVVYLISGEDTTSVLIGFTITGGTGTKFNFTHQGFQHIGRGGGGIICWYSGARISSNKIIYNTVSDDGYVVGGGICAGHYGSNAYVIIEHNQIRNNEINGVSGAYGGGVGLVCNGMLVDNNISYNSSISSAYEGTGGGVVSGAESALLPRAVLIKENIITHNFAEGIFNSPHYGSRGGGIDSWYSKIIIVDNQILYNRLDAIQNGEIYGQCFGGGIYLSDAHAESVISGNKILYNTIVDHNTQDAGGGICLWRCNTPIINNIIAGNTARTGGGIALHDSDPDIVNNTIVNNIVSLSGGGLSSSLEFPPVIKNTILYANEAFLEPQISGIVSVYYSDIQGGWAGEGNIDTDPLFTDDTLNYYLSLNSPCIDTGNPKADYYDIEDPGNPGLPLWPALGTLHNDMGAYGGPYKTVTALEQNNLNHKVPDQFVLFQNYPNPFNPSTTIEFQIPNSEFTTLKVYNILGEEVSTLVSKKLNQGNHTYQFDGKNLASGVYYYQLVAGEYREVKKMILLR